MRSSRHASNRHRHQYGLALSQIDRIRFSDLSRQHETIAPDLRAAFERVVSASAFTLGQEVAAFEHEFASYCGVRHCVGTASGTAAITLALIASGIGAGDEVIVPSHTFAATALGVMHAGAIPVLCDVDAATGLIDLGSAGEAVGERTVAIMPVHLYGQLCDMGAVAAFADRHRIAVFEDAAQAHGAAVGGRRAGAFGRAAAFSFYPSKNLGALGDGGAITTDDDDLAGRARALRNLGQGTKGIHLEAGYNERLDGLQAAFLRAKLPHLDAWNEARRRAAAEYRRTLPPSLRLLEERAPGACVYHLFPVRLGQRSSLSERLEAGGIETGVHYYPPLHRQAAIEHAARRVDDLREADAWAREELSLPIFPELQVTEIQRIGAICRKVVS
jgi:dTDP-4-amino-4,6-dideoxygalactose transaminase